VEVTDQVEEAVVAVEEEAEEDKRRLLKIIPINNTILNYEKSIHTIHRCACYVCK
jgi:hypothetical protein